MSRLDDRPGDRNMSTMSTRPSLTREVTTSFGDRVQVTADGWHGDVHFMAETDGEVLSFEIGWGHCLRQGWESDADWSAGGFTLYASGDMHDGYRTLGALLDNMPERVYLSLEDYRAERSVALGDLIDVARAWADLPSIAECDESWLYGDSDAE